MCNVVTGFGANIDDDLTGHADFDFVTFTGTTFVGQHIVEICAKPKTRKTLELGGVSPTVVLADADLDKIMPLAAIESSCGVLILPRLGFRH